MMAAALHAHKEGGHAVSMGSDSRPVTPARAAALAKVQRVAVRQTAPVAGGESMMSAMMMKRVMLKAKRLRKGFPKHDVDKDGNEMHRILKLNEVVRLASKSDDKVWRKRSMKKRHAQIVNEFRKAVINVADDVQFLVRCFDLLDEDGFEELTAQEMMRWVKLLVDPAGVGDGDLLWVQTMGTPLGDEELRKDLMTRVGKGVRETEPRFDWQDFVIITLDFYVLAGSAAMRRTFGELLKPDGAIDSVCSASGQLVPQPPKEPKKKASLADDVRERRAAMAAGLGKELGLQEQPPQSDPAPGAADAPDATVGSGGGRPEPPEDTELAGDDDHEVKFSGSEDTVDLSTELLDEEKASQDEWRVAEVVPGTTSTIQEEPRQP